MQCFELKRGYCFILEDCLASTKGESLILATKLFGTGYKEIFGDGKL